MEEEGQRCLGVDVLVLGMQLDIDLRGGSNGLGLEASRPLRVGGPNGPFDDNRWLCEVQHSAILGAC